MISQASHGRSDSPPSGIGNECLVTSGCGCGGASANNSNQLPIYCNTCITNRLEPDIDVQRYHLTDSSEESLIPGTQPTGSGHSVNPSVIHCSLENENSQTNSNFHNYEKYPQDLSLPALSMPMIIENRVTRQMIPDTPSPRQSHFDKPITNATLESMGKGMVILIQPEDQVEGKKLLNNPIILNRMLIKQFKHVQIQDIRVNHRKGLVALESKTALTNNQIDELANITNLDNIKVKCYIPNSDAVTYGVVSPIDIDIQVDELQKYMTTRSDIEIHSITRLKKRENNVWIDSPSIKIAFRTRTIPTTVYFECVRYNVRPYTATPMQCFKCQRLGHTTKSCRATISRCMICSGPHTKDTCTANLQKCANCGGEHLSNSRDCRFIKDAMQIEKLKANNNMSYSQARNEVIRNKETHNREILIGESQDYNLNIPRQDTTIPTRSNTDAHRQDTPQFNRSYSQVVSSNRKRNAYVNQTKTVRVSSETQTERCECLDKEFFIKLKQMILEVMKINFSSESARSRELLVENSIRNVFGMEAADQNLDGNNNETIESTVHLKKRKLENNEPSTEDDNVISDESNISDAESIFTTIEKVQVKKKKENNINKNKQNRRNKKKKQNGQ